MRDGTCVLILRALSKSMCRCAFVRFSFVNLQCCRPRVHLEGVVRQRFAWARRRPSRGWEQSQGDNRIILMPTILHRSVFAGVCVSLLLC